MDGWLTQCDCDGACKAFLAHSGRFDMTVHAHTHIDLDCNSRLCSGGCVTIAIQMHFCLWSCYRLKPEAWICQTGAGGQALQIKQPMLFIGFLEKPSWFADHPSSFQCRVCSYLEYSWCNNPVLLGQLFPSELIATKPHPEVPCGTWR